MTAALAIDHSAKAFETASSIDSSQSKDTQATMLQQKFLRWQCRIRQSLVREYAGKPDAGVMPEVSLAQNYLDNEQFSSSLGTVITLIHKSTSFSVLPEIRHMARQSHDPALRREQALRFFQAEYYQDVNTFSDVITASFAPSAQRAKTIMAASQCRLCYNAYGHAFELRGKPEKLSAQHYFFQTSWWHNFLFNPYLSEDITVLAFVIDWQNSRCID